MKSSKIKVIFSQQEKYLLILVIISALFSFFKFSPNYFWDLNVYQNAVNIFNSGGSPYLDLDGLKFVYSPYILILFSLLGKNLSLILILYYISSSLLILKKNIGLKLILYSIISSLLFFNDFFIKSIATGNLTIFLHFSILNSAFIKPKKHLEVFLLTVAACSLIKPYLFAYVFLGYALWPRKKNYFKLIVITGLSIALLFLSQFFFTPELFRGFTESLYNQAIGDVNGPGRDVGKALYWIFANSLKRQYALGLHFIIVILLGKSFFNLGQSIVKLIKNEDSKKLLFFICLISITLINPRMKVYDYWIVLGSSVGIIFTLFLQPYFLSRKIKFLSLILTGLIFMFLDFPVIYKIYIPPSISYFLCFYFYKTQKLSNNSLQQEVQILSK